MHITHGRRNAMSLIEVVIIVVILGIITAIAVPRITHAGQTAAENSLTGDMAVWRNALDLYQSQHNGAYPKDHTTLLSQLTQFTDLKGETSPVKDADHPLGPCLRAVPPLPLGLSADGVSLRGNTNIGPALIGGAPSTIVAGDYGWLYDGAGNIYPNTGSLTDASGKPYNSY